MKRRIQRVHQPKSSEKAARIRTTSGCSTMMMCRHFVLFLLLWIQQQHFSHALISSSNRHAPKSRSAGTIGTGWGTRSNLYSPLFFGKARRLEWERRQIMMQRQHRSSTALSMVLTTPESIIEQASTVNLLDDLIDESVRTSPRRPIIMQFDPSSGWIWRRWKGTIFSETWRSCVRNMLYATLVYFVCKRYPFIKGHLSGFGTLWGQLLSITTFTLTFFTNNAYALWKNCLGLSRRLQGRLHDIGLNLATHATRKVPTNSTETSKYTAASRQILELMSRYIRLFDLLTYASFTRSHRPVLTPRGMRRLVERGLMTAQEREVLVDAAIPATQRHSAILMWMMRLFVEGRASGHILGGDGFEQETLEKFHVIRAQYGAIGDELQGRMPLAYAHVVQILVDVILWMYPVMAFTIDMSPIVGILGTGLLTISYQGLFDLAKQFLDPYDNENYGKGEDPLSVDTLIAETNAGSVRWMYGFEEMPFSQQKVKDGELYDYLLPVRGYSVEELAQMEEEKKKREKEMAEQRAREEQERLQREADEALRAESAGDDLSATESQALESNSTSVGNSTNGEGPDGGTEEITPPAVDRPVHKIFTLADGTVVSFNDEPDVLSPKPVARKPAIPKGAATYLASLSREEELVMATNAEEEKQEELLSEETDIPGSDAIDLDETQDLPLFDDVSPEGNAMPPSQIAANEEPTEADEDVAITLSREELEKTIEEAKETARLELLQAIEISSSPPVGITKEKRKEAATSMQQLIELVDPTDDRAQMVEDLLQRLQSPETPKKEVVGVGGDSIASKRPEEKIIVDKFPFTSAINSAMANKSQSTDDSTPPPSGKVKATPPSKESVDSKPSKESVDGKEPTAPPRLTLLDYNEQVKKIIETAKEELLETEAILKARPGADPLGWDYDAKQLAPSTDGVVVEKVVAEEPEEEPDLNLDVLEMDMAEEEPAEVTAAVSDKTATAMNETAEDIVMDGDQEPDESERAPEALSDDETAFTEGNPVQDSLEDEIEVIEETEDALPDEEDEVVPEAKGSDPIEPIFIEEEEESLDDAIEDSDPEVNGE